MKGDVEAFCCIHNVIPHPWNLVTPQEDESVLNLAAKCNGGNVAFVDYVLDNGGRDLIDYPQRDGKTPLWAAIYHSGSVAMVKLMLANGASLVAPPSNTRADFSPIAEFHRVASVSDFLQPLLREWLVKMKNVSRIPTIYNHIDVDTSMFLEQVHEPLLHAISFLDTRDCATLQVVSRYWHSLTRHRLDRYSILLGVLDTYYPLLESGQMTDSNLLGRDLDAEERRERLQWVQAFKDNQQRIKEYASNFMGRNMFSIVYELLMWTFITYIV